jgi:hypothetical protein
MATLNKQEAPLELPLDVPTIMAIGVVTFIIANVLHEGVGHGGACLLVGGVPQELSTAHFSCSVDDSDGWQARVVSSAGTLVNFMAALVFGLCFRRMSSERQALRYFCWLAMCNNYFVAAGYPLFSGVLNLGDWVSVTRDWHPEWMWRLLLISIGAVLYFAVGIPMALKNMATLIGSHPADRLTRAFKLTFWAYLAGAAATSIGALFNPIGPFLIFTSAAAAFGGNSAFAWMTQLLKGERFANTSESRVQIERSWPWIGAAAATLAVHIAILGPTIKFG